MLQPVQSDLYANPTSPYAAKVTKMPTFLVPTEHNVHMKRWAHKCWRSRLCQVRNDGVRLLQAYFKGEARNYKRGWQVLNFMQRMNYKDSQRTSSMLIWGIYIQTTKSLEIDTNELTVQRCTTKPCVVKCKNRPPDHWTDQ